MASNKPDIDEIKHHFAGIFLVTDSKKVIGQRRDNKPDIDNPNKVGTFGGTVEAGETPEQAVLRELVEEETNLEVTQKDIHHLVDDVVWRALTSEWEARHFYYAFINETDLETMEVYEGQGWAQITSPDDIDLIELWRDPARILFKELNLI